MRPYTPTVNLNAGDLIPLWTPPNAIINVAASNPSVPSVAFSQALKVSTVTTINLAPSSTPADGSWMVATITIGQTGVTVTPPTGWTKILTETVIGSRIAVAFAKIKASGDTYTFTFSTSTGGTGILIGGAGASAVSNWILGAATLRAASGGTNQNKAASVTTTVANSKALALSFEATGAAETGPPSATAGWSLGLHQGQDTGGSGIEANTIMYKDMATAGATGDVLFTYTNTQPSNGLAMQIALPPGAGSAARTLTIPRGYTVTQMMSDFSTHNVFWAHRGGSVDAWPEESARGYTNSVWYGARAIEFSFWKTSDGVLVGSHDQNTVRVTGTSWDVTTKTWADIQTLTQTVPTGSAPIFRIEDLLNAYKNLVLILDDKQKTNWTQLKGLLDALVPDPTNHVIIKGYGSDTWATAPRAAGYKVWSYFYDNEVTTLVPAADPNVDIYGLNYDASSGNWTTLAGYGKPIIAHVVPDAAGKSAAEAKGAVGFQMALIQGVVPKINDLP